MADFTFSHHLRLINRPLDRFYYRFKVVHAAFIHPARWATASANNIDLTIREYFTHESGDGGSAYVQTNNNVVIDSLSHRFSLVLTLVQGTNPPRLQYHT
ncbi:Uncharacterised protein [Vibrio cholerae]|uniref:Uncharacterized protein n=1 Tax=Vibrio cholerae TaxID=666 RepID=A0A655W177_VIBCL|nr:Uncharacterised protein [Vibrio cholerae]CSC00225.1 Uncharacterised protein [Vibrio cholerae]CSC25700.1 Uncharacterised protein [Vibrio cholerae]CSC51992.1 Uncharacterised protein [Vibrio cholerae]CSC77788.1 Uncharacterised protein [Vibrio cholerae]